MREYARIAGISKVLPGNGLAVEGNGRSLIVMLTEPSLH